MATNKTPDQWPEAPQDTMEGITQPLSSLEIADNQNSQSRETLEPSYNPVSSPYNHMSLPTATLPEHSGRELSSPSSLSPSFNEDPQSKMTIRRRPERLPRTARKSPLAPRPPKPTHNACHICFDELPVADFPRYIPPGERNADNPTDIPFGCIPHMARDPECTTMYNAICNACIGQSMVGTHEIFGAKRVSTGCAFVLDCQTHWDFDFIMRYFPKGAPLEKYNMDMMNVYIHEHDFVQCINRACDALGLRDDSSPGYPQVQCPSDTCKTRFCISCRVPWHEGLSCQEWTADNGKEDEDQVTLKLAQSRNAKRCPNCYLVVEKGKGCDRMMCGYCQRFFTWGDAADAVPESERPSSVDLWGPANVCEVDAAYTLERERREENLKLHQEG